MNVFNDYPFASKVGDTGCYFSSLWWASPDVLYNWYIPFDEIYTYSEDNSPIRDVILSEQVLYSPQAQWGIMTTQLKVISQIVSKDGHYTALIVVSDGGATTAFDYKVLLRNSDSKLPLSRESVIFRSYSDPTPEKIRFTARNTIEIHCDNGSVFTVSFDERTLNPDRKLKFYRGKPWE